MFFGTECPHCHTMDPVVDRLEKEIGRKLHRLEVWHNEANSELLKSYDQGFCGGVPFFYNEETGEKICGETPFDRLKVWTGRKKE